MQNINSKNINCSRKNTNENTKTRLNIKDKTQTLEGKTEY